MVGFQFLKYTPTKTDMDLQNGGLEDVFLFKKVIFRFCVNFRGSIPFEYEGFFSELSKADPCPKVTCKPSIICRLLDNNSFLGPCIFSNTSC